jgi:hypothetical protein
MKKILLVLLTFTLLVFYSCQEKIDVEKEKAAIIKVLNDEGSRFIANDMEGVSALHVQGEQALRLEGSDIYSGWDKIKNLYDTYIERNKKDTTFTNSQNIKENIIIKVTGNSAWLVCDNIWKWKVNGQPEENINIQIAFFEKINNEWKFSFNAFMPKDTLR